jgi:hypothetical protein
VLHICPHRLVENPNPTKANPAKRKKSQTKAAAIEADGFDMEPDLLDGEEREPKKQKVLRGSAIAGPLCRTGKTGIYFLARKILHS